PENNRYGRPGFPSVLREIGRVFREDRDRITANARAIREHVDRTLDETKPGAVDAQVLTDAADQMARLYDVRYGGFGTAPKFPHPAACEFLLARWHDTGLEWQRDIVEKTLTAMARGGVRDHVGGGFHRYTVDERWIVPHFEKMSYDNSELLRAYLSAYQAFGTPLFRQVATGIVDWVLEVLAVRDAGAEGFAASQDADVAPGDDGDYWTWTVEEAKGALTASEFAVASAVFDIQEAGEMHHNPAKNVLWWKQDPAGDDAWPLLRDALRKLKAARDRRTAPFVDRALYVNWNAMLAGAMLQAGAVLDRPECNTVALRVLERIWTESCDPRHGVARIIGRAEPRAWLDDNVQSAAAFLDAYEATGDAVWLDRAAQVMEYCLASHWDQAAGGFFDLAAGAQVDGGYLHARAKPVQDAPTPSPNGVAALVLGRLATLTDQPRWRDVVQRQLAAFAGAARDLSLYGATLLRAIDRATQPVTRIEVA
ncbi:MAG: thioredoxin domain-containing protein, partial [Burkholderiales bacterium]